MSKDFLQNNLSAANSEFRASRESPRGRCIGLNKPASGERGAAEIPNFRRENYYAKGLKIPCSVGILTLNSSRTLKRCLGSVKDFAEIIVCDGNSTDDTLNIARELGCKIIKQYDSDEPNLSCISDKAAVRNRNMEAATYDWYLYLDSDDALSKEVVGEIKKIAENPNPPFLVYRMPLRTFIRGKKVEYSSNYPMYQNRFFNRQTGAYFIKPVHERIKFDEEKFKVGTLKNCYEVHMSEEKFLHPFREAAKYARFEVKKWKKISAPAYFKWVWKHPIRQVARVILYSSGNYLGRGFKKSMSPKIELSRAAYHLFLFWRITKKQLGLNLYRDV